MKINPFNKTVWRLLTVAALALAATARAGLGVPYAVDANTLQLWHLDQSSGLTSTNAVLASPIIVTNVGNLAAVLGAASANAALTNSYRHSGTADSSANRNHCLRGPVFPNVSQFCNPVTGAFTFEALVKFNFTPAPQTVTIDGEIVCADSALAGRGWLWRIFNGVMEWNLLGSSTTADDFKVSLPTTGADAAVAGAWYHVAVTYTGESPTNGDTAQQLQFYWTALDSARSTASPLGTPFTMSRPLSGYPVGSGSTITPSLGIGGSSRSTATEGLIGNIDEVRISSVARQATDMAFVSGGCVAPVVSSQPVTNTLIGYGQTLTLTPLVSASAPATFQWQFNGVAVPGQTNVTLVVPNMTFANQGIWQLMVTNGCGTVSTTPAQVTVGAVPSELFATALDTNGVLLSGGAIDPHWTLSYSDDPYNLGPNTTVLYNNANFSPSNGVSYWLTLYGSANNNSPIGIYKFRTQCLIDSAVPSTVNIQGTLWMNSAVRDIVVNGKSTGISLNTGLAAPVLYAQTFTLSSNLLVSGLNTIDFVVTNQSPGQTAFIGVPALRVQMSGVGQALAPGLPLITNQPVNQVVRDANAGSGSAALFSVVALGRPPLAYQWWADGAPISGATNRALTFANPTAGAQGTNFSVVVQNDSGSVTSSVAMLTLVPTNQPPVPATFNLATFPGQTASVSMSDFVLKSMDPDNDPISFSSVDYSSTNGTSIYQVNASLTYTANPGFVGFDQFSYMINDPDGGYSQGFVNILNLDAEPTNEVVAPNGSATFTSGVTGIIPGYSFQWRQNGANLTGATNGVLNFASAQPANAGTYTLVVSNTTGVGWTSAPVYLTVGLPGSGTGLTGEYYNFTGTYSSTNTPIGPFDSVPVLTELDPTVNFDWGTSSPDGGVNIGVDNFTARWYGMVQPLYTQPYTFYAKSDDGSRLWINGQIVVNNWFSQGSVERSGTISLVANQKYSLLMEYFEKGSGASVQLSWSSTNQFKQVIPSTQLYPTPGLGQPQISFAVAGNTNLILNWAGTYSVLSATNLLGPWVTNLNDTTSPYVWPLTNGAAFFRLLQP